MREFKCFIIDDEPLAIDVIVHHLKQLNQFEVSGTCTNALEAYKALKSVDVDLIFLDIEMPELSGLDFIKSIRIRPEVIVTTAYRDFAVEAFDLDILDYLVKPISLSRFMKAIDRFLDRKSESNHTNIGDPASLLIRAERKFLRINVSDIIYVEGLKDYVKIVLADRQILTKQSIGAFIKSLPKDDFIRSHRSFIVSKRNITAYTSHDVELGEIELPIGRSYKEEFIRAMEKGK